VFATPARDGPVYLRLENEDRGALPGGTDGMPPGSVTLLRSGGRDALLLALGPAAFDALAAAEALQAAGIGASVAVVASLRPLDTGAVFAALGAAPLLVTLENHAIDGGLGSLMAEAAADAGRPLRLLRTGVTERDFAPGRPGYLRAALGLDGPALARRIAQALRGA
jgi:transketolase